MEEHIVKIISIEPVTHNVKHFKVEKPRGYQFIPGQATEVAINKSHWKDDKLGNNRLIFSNKKHNDIILKDEFTAVLGENFINTLTQEEVAGYDHHKIDEEYLRQKISDFSQHFYICGPDAMVKNVQTILQKLVAADNLIT